MRELIFRGKLHDDGKWIAWSLLGAIFADKSIEVDFETVGQYTGLTDKNGKKIFEGDILKGMGGLYRVYFDTSLSCFEWAKINGNWQETFSGFADEYEIIGNIHDNPELLKEGD